MKVVGKIVLLILFFALSANAQVEPEELNPEDYFDFWIGKWEVTWDEGNGKKGQGTNIIEKTLDGKVIQENFRITEGSNAGFKGTSISVYQPKLERWKQAWADNSGGYYDFYGKLDGEKRIFQTEVHELEDGSNSVMRMVFYEITNNSLTWDWETSDDGGKTWKLKWRIFYSRIE